MLSSKFLLSFCQSLKLGSRRIATIFIIAWQTTTTDKVKRRVDASSRIGVKDCQPSYWFCQISVQFFIRETLILGTRCP